MNYIDVHTHLTDERIDADKLYNSLVGFTLINAGFDEKSTLRAKGLSQKYSFSYYTAGLHPEELIDEKLAFLDKILDFCSDNKCVGIGECGLDYHFRSDNKELQKEVFTKHIEIANSVGLPVVIHSRDALQDTFDIISKNKKLLPNGFLLHCYSYSGEMAKEFVKLGAYFSFGGAITFKNAKKEKVISEIPIERVLSETDSPYMSPEPYRGRLNTSANIPIIVNKLAEIYGVENDKMRDIIYENSKKLFKRIV